MAGRRISEWDVLNRFLTVAIGSHRGTSWSLGRQRQAAFDGIWNDLVGGLADDLTVVTDSNQNTSCVFDMPNQRAVLYVSTVLPRFIVWSGTERCYLDICPDWATMLGTVGFTYLDSASTRTLSPYRDEEADRRMTYYELLFEWIEGSDGPPEHELIDPWVP